MSILLDYILNKSQKKKLSASEWLMQIAPFASKCCFVTHNGKYTNPSATTMWKANINTVSGLPYVATCSVQCKDDIYVSAKYLPIASLLQLPLDDGRTFYEHLLDDDDFIREELGAMLPDYDFFRKQLLDVSPFTKPDYISKSLNQVYFPIANKKYHLLTVLPPSSIIHEVRSRIRKIEDYAYTHKDTVDRKQNPLLHRGKLIRTKYGGSKPQNISVNNNICGGRSYMLPCFPPKLDVHDISIPYKNFFSTIRYKKLSNLFYDLHKSYADWHHNKEARIAVRNAETAIMDAVFQYVYLLRQKKEGWSDASAISKVQAIFLDNKYSEVRFDNKNLWLKAVSSEFARWIINTYRKILGEKSVILEDGEFKALCKQVEDYILKEMRG